MDERIVNLVNIALTQAIYPEPVKVEYDPIWVCQPDCIIDALKFKEYMQHQTVVTDYGIRFAGYVRYDGSFRADLFHRSGHKRWQEVASQYYLKPYRNLVTFEWEHSTLNYEQLLALGIDGLRGKIAASEKVHAGEPEKLHFLTALSIVCDGIDLWCEHLADGFEQAARTASPERAAELRETAADCRRVPKYPAKTFREALQAMTICFQFLPDSIGLADRYLYPFYRDGLADGTLTRDDAKSMLQELFIMIKSMTSLNSVNSDKGGESHFAIGGYNERLEDNWNDLSELILEALMELPICCPQISLRWTKKTPFDVLYKVLDYERHDKFKRIAVINDEPRIDAYHRHLGHSIADAVNYTTVGCNETAFPGGMDFTGMNCNIAQSVTRMIYDRRDELLNCKTFDDVFALFRQQLDEVLKEIIVYQNGFNYARSKDDNVLSSLFMNGCIDNAVSVTKGGGSVSSGNISTCGLISVIDSLSMIRQIVFEEKKVSLRELCLALDADWDSEKQSGAEELRTYILKNGRFFGNNDPLSNETAVRITNTFAELLKDKTDSYGNHFLVGAMDGYNPHSAWFGNQTKATPDGRYTGDPFMVGVGQINGKDRKGMTPLLLSVAHMDPSHIVTASLVFNLNLDESLINDDERFMKTVRMLEVYLKEGGTQFQLNYVSRETLLAARENPENYASLRVRVSGFSAYYTRLKPLIQDELLLRTEIDH